VNEAGTVEVVRTSPLEVSALSHDGELLSLKNATVIFCSLALVSKCL
jgi:hypothetical protein